VSKFFSIGEALIDFVPSKIGVQLKKVPSFTKTAGGAPANVCACLAKQNIDSKFIGKLGDDAFGDFLLDTMNSVGIDTSFVSKTDEANTALAFVSLKEDGDREFSFYRKPSADMLLNQDEIIEDWFSKGDFLHFCSVNLIEAPVKYAHIKAIESVKKNGGVVVFDPNLRFPLWDDLDALRQTVLQFANYADIIKISDNELEFITGTADVKAAANMMFKKGIKVFLYTMGKDGARVITKDVDVTCDGFEIKAVDATGAGDAFIGGFISCIISGAIDYANMDSDICEKLLTFANACGAIVATKHGAIMSMPTTKEVLAFIEKNN
jgi:fructokinase